MTDSFTTSPVSGASVTWGSGYSTTTAANGGYSFNNITCGTATLTVTANGYQTYFLSYTPTCNASNLKNITLIPGLSGIVSGSNTYAGQLTPVFIQLFPAPGHIDPTKQTWIVIHGRNSSSTNTSGANIVRLCQAIKFVRPTDQVLVLDWRQAAQDKDPTDINLGSTAFQHDDWIEPVAQWAATKLTSYGFSGLSLNLVGHSWGGNMTDEIAKRISGGVNTIVALDPAKNGVFGYHGVYNPDLIFGLPTAQNNFARNSQYSWAFHSSFEGSEYTATSADEGFIVDTGLNQTWGDAHNASANLFSYMLEHSTDTADSISPLFQLQRLLSHTPGPWVLDQKTTLPFCAIDFFGAQTLCEDIVSGYEGVISTVNNLTNPVPYDFSYVSTAPTITLLGNGTSIVDGDTTPSLTDGTDFGGVTQGQAGPTRTFTVRNDGGSTLALGIPSVPAGFVLDMGLYPNLAPGASDTFTVHLDTSSAGTNSGQISFTNNTPNQNPFNFSISGTVNSLPTIAIPTISPNGGSYSGSVLVTLGCSTSGALIYFTTDESDPTTSSTSYQGPFTLTASATVKAKAFLSGYNPSATASANFTVTPAPTRIISLGGNLIFGNVQTGSVAQSTMTINNTGNSTMTVSSISYPIGFNGNWGSGTVSAGGYQNVTVTFAPTAVTSYGGTVTVNSDKTSGVNTMTASGTGTTIPPTTGSLQVSIAPGAAITAGALWQVDAGAWQTSGTTVSSLSAGNHTVSFNTVSGWTKPANQNVSINANQTTTATGIYVIISDTTPPSIAITSPTNGPSFTTSNATVNLSGTASDNVGVTLVTWGNNRGGSGSASGTTSWNVNGIQLATGTNVISVTAYDAAGNSTPSTLTVMLSTIVTPPPPNQLTGFGLSNGVVRFVLNGPVGSNYVIYASSDLKYWTPMTTNSIPSAGWINFVDPASGGYSQRFYRALPPGVSVTLLSLPQLTGMRINTNGMFLFTLNGPVGSSYVIQVSSNLVNWVNLVTNVIPAGGLRVLDFPIQTNQRAMYYRALPLAQGPLVLQPGPIDGQAIWTTSIYSNGTNTVGANGIADENFLVGGWGTFTTRI